MSARTPTGSSSSPDPAPSTHSPDRLPEPSRRGGRAPDGEDSTRSAMHPARAAKKEGSRTARRPPPRLQPRRASTTASPSLAGERATRIPAPLQGLDLVFGPAAPARDDRAGVAHAPPRRRGHPGDESRHRFPRLRAPDEVRRLLLRAPPDLADHDDRLGLVVPEEHLQAVDEAGAVHRVAADPDAGGLPRDPPPLSGATAS